MSAGHEAKRWCRGLSLITQRPAVLAPDDGDPLVNMTVLSRSWPREASSTPRRRAPACRVEMWFLKVSWRGFNCCTVVYGLAALAETAWASGKIVCHQCCRVFSRSMQARFVDVLEKRGAVSCVCCNL